MEKTKNERGIIINKSCVTCRFSRYNVAKQTNDVESGIVLNCRRLMINRKRTDCCEKYDMKGCLKALGDIAEGRVKRKEYIAYVSHVRMVEGTKRVAENRIQSIEKITDDFVRARGDIYMTEAEVTQLAKAVVQKQKERDFDLLMMRSTEEHKREQAEEVERCKQRRMHPDILP